MTALLSRFRDHVTRRGLFPAPGVAVVAVSGGADSVALLDLLHGLGPELGLSLVVAHADHGIQPDSRAVGQAVGALAHRYALPFELGELHLGAGATETTARRARYAWLRAVQQARGAPYLVTAHHADDQVETVLLRVLKGSAPAGLAGVGARSRDGLVRPLLPFRKAELVAHVAARALPVHDDPANRDPRHLRSWIRTVLLPLLETELPEVHRAVLRVGRHARRERRAWAGMLDLLADLDARVRPHGFDVAREPLARYDDAIAVALMRAAAFRAGIALGPTRARRLVQFAARPSGRRLALGGDVMAEVAFDRLRVGSAHEQAAERVVAGAGRGSAVFGAFRVDWSPEPAPPSLPRGAWTTWLAEGEGEWEVRGLRPGDRLIPLGAEGHREVRRLLMEARVPRGERGQYPIVARGDTILWVPGVCRSTADLPQPGTPAVRVDVTEHGEPQADRRA